MQWCNEAYFCTEKNFATLKYILPALFSCFFFLSSELSACSVDVTINEGAFIEMCADAPVGINALAGFVSYAWTGPETLSGQSITPQFSGQYTVSAVDGVGCISQAVIDVLIHVNPVPIILSSEGNPLCASSPGTQLSVSQPFVSYDWGGGNTSPTLFAPGVGTYGVTVVDANGCAGQSTIAITGYNFNLSTSLLEGCFGSTAVLQASGGNSYAWSTGESGSTIVVSPTSSTVYSVSITSGTCTEILSATVDAIAPYTYDLVDSLFMSLNDTEILIGPPGSFTYNWFPDEQIDNAQGASVLLTAAESHTLYVQATHETGCVILDSVVIVVIDLSIPDGISPNGDGVNELFIIPQLYNLDASISIWNRWGDLVFKSDRYENNWDGTCKTSLCLGSSSLPEGTYFYSIGVRDINFTGYITLKL